MSLFLYFNLEISQSMLSFIFFLVLLKLTPLVALQTFIWLWRSISLTEFPCHFSVAFFYTGVDLCFDLLHNMYDSLSFLLSLCSHLHHSKLLSRVMFFIIIIIIIMVSSSQSLLQCNKLQVNHTAGSNWSMIGK